MSIHLEDDFHCFACGSLNEKGLRIEWKVEGKRTFAEFTPKKEHQGWKGIVHGGILATLLDEAMTRTAWLVGGGALTAEMNVRYLKKAYVGEKLYILGEVSEKNRRIIETNSIVFKNIPSPASPLNQKEFQQRSLSEISKDPSLEIIARAQGKAIKP